MQIIDKRTRERGVEDVVFAPQIPVGTVFEGEHYMFPVYKGVFLRSYSTVVSLTNPQEDWGPNKLHTIGFRNYRQLNAHLMLVDSTKII